MYQRIVAKIQGREEALPERAERQEPGKESNMDARKKKGATGRDSESDQPRGISRYGWIPDLPDYRDHSSSIQTLRTAALALPPAVDLSSSFPPILDQGDLGSCTANAAANIHFFDQRRQKGKNVFLPSRLQIYYDTRARQRSQNFDSGASIRETIKTLVKQGACPELMWPYDIKRFALKPAPVCYTEAKKHQALVYERLMQTLNSLRGCLASGFPFIFGFSVYEGFESAAVVRSGNAEMPQAGESLLGGHAVVAVGYDDVTRRFKIANSWGVQVGQRGFYTMPYEYVSNSNLAADFWVVRSVEQ